MVAAENAAENPVFEAEHLSQKKRVNGDTVSADLSPTPTDPCVYKGSRAGDSLGSPAPVSEMGTDSGLKLETGTELDYASFDVPGADPSDDV